MGEGAAAGALTTGAADKALGVVKAVQGLAGVALPVDAFVALDAGACEGRAGQWLPPPLPQHGSRHPKLAQMCLTDFGTAPLAFEKRGQPETGRKLDFRMLASHV